MRSPGSLIPTSRALRSSFLLQLALSQLLAQLLDGVSIDECAAVAQHLVSTQMTVSNPASDRLVMHAKSGSGFDDRNQLAQIGA